MPLASHGRGIALGGELTRVACLHLEGVWQDGEQENHDHAYCFGAEAIATSGLDPTVDGLAGTVEEEEVDQAGRRER